MSLEDEELPDMRMIPHPELEQWLIKICRQLEIWGEKYATRRATYEQLKDCEDIIFHGAMPLVGTGVEKERLAFLSPEYQQHMTGLGDARLLYYKAQIKYDATRAKFDAVRSILSIRKQEIERKL